MDTRRVTAVCPESRSIPRTWYTLHCIAAAASQIRPQRYSINKSSRLESVLGVRKYGVMICISAPWNGQYTTINITTAVVAGRPEVRYRGWGKGSSQRRGRANGGGER